MTTPLDTKIISKLAEILDKNNLTELEYESEECRICLTRGLSGPAPIAYAPAPIAAAPQTIAVTCAAPTPAAVAVEDFAAHPGAMKSPMVGIIYLSPEPNADDYVKVGSTVKEGDTLCLIEAMKTFNPVKASHSGKVAKILVEAGDPVEYGQVLMIIE